MISLFTTSSLLGVGLLMTLGIALTGCAATTSMTNDSSSISESNRAVRERGQSGVERAFAGPRSTPSGMRLPCRP